MRYFANEQKVVTESVLKGIVCNKCGEIFDPNYADSSQQFKVIIGYNSKFTSNFQFDLCEKCLIELIKQFKHVPDNFMNRSGYTPSYIEDSERHQVSFENWKLTNEWNDDGDNPLEEYINPDISYDTEFDLNENDKFIEEFYDNHKMNDRKPLPQTTLKIVK